MDESSQAAPVWTGQVEVGTAVPQRGNWVSRKIGQGVMRFRGWKIEGTVPNRTHLVILGGPHTSNWDWMLAMSFIFGMGLQFHWLGKHTFVDHRFFGPILRWMGGVPVDRRAAQGIVGQAIDEFKRREKFWLGIAPEGTRSKVDRWKTGFYHIAIGADVPVMAISADYSRKVLIFRPIFHLTGDIDADIAFLRSYYTKEMACNPEKF